MLNLITADRTTTSETDASVARRWIAVVRFGVGLLAVTVITIVVVLALCATAIPRVMGWRSVAIISGSMEPAVEVGDVLVAEPYDGQELQPGWILVFHDPAGDGLISHRLDAVNPDGSLTTRGDANRGTDSTPIDPDAVVGIGRILVPSIGWPTVWAASADATAMLIAAFAAFVVLYASRWGLMPRFDPWQAPLIQLAPADSASAADGAPDDLTLIEGRRLTFDPDDSRLWAELHREASAAAEAWLTEELAVSKAGTTYQRSTRRSGFLDHLQHSMIQVQRPTDAIAPSEPEPATH